VQRDLGKKSRGAFFTPAPIAQFLAHWAIRSSADSILEPSCGEASFLIAAARELSILGSRLTDPQQLSGVEIYAPSARAAEELLARHGAKCSIATGDFFLQEPERQFDAVIGNPPFIRYQDFSGAVRARSLEAALSQGVRLSGLASSWAAFTVHASRFVASNGRLGLVLPAELLTVGYAAEVRRYLLRRFATVRLVLFEQRVFPEVLEDTILLLAEGEGAAGHFEVYQAKTADDLSNLQINGWTDHRPDASDRWTPALLDTSAYDAFLNATECADVGHLSEWGTAYLGAVTGNNSFFCLSDHEMESAGLTRADVRPISPPGARHLKGFTLSSVAWEALRREGKRVHLFWPGEVPSEAAKQYIARGEATGVHKAYKCRVRSPWWRVPLPARPDFIVTYMNDDRLRFVRNSSEADILNSVYGFKLSTAVKFEDAKHLPLSLLNSVTLLSAELSGRVHGGGLLKHEPRDLDKLAVPSLACLQNAEERIEAIAPQIGRLLRKSALDEAVRLVDESILIGAAGISRDVLETVQIARDRLANRRKLLGAKT
jgi:adenine-specific DNA methylase